MAESTQGGHRSPHRRTAAAASTPAAGIGPGDRRVPGGPRRVELTGRDLRRARLERDALSLLMAKLGWDGSLGDWIEMLDRMEGDHPEMRHFRSSVPQMFIVEMAVGDGEHRAAEQRVFDAVLTVNRRWRARTGRPLIGITLG